MTKSKKHFDLNEVVEQTGLRPSQVNYLIQDRRIDPENVIRKGSGQKRLFNEKAIEQIRNYYDQ